MTNEYEIFLQETNGVGQNFMDMVINSSERSALDRKTQELAYIAVLTAVRLTGGIDFHVKSAKQLGATKEEIKSAVLVALPAVGISILEALETALNSYDD